MRIAVAGYDFDYLTAQDGDSVFVDKKDAERPGDVVHNLGAFRCAVVSVEEHVVVRRNPSRRPDAFVKVSFVARLRGR